MTIGLQIILNGLVVATLYALVAVGLSFLYATTRIFHLAHGAVAVAAGYALGTVLTKGRPEEVFRDKRVLEAYLGIN